MRCLIILFFVPFISFAEINTALQKELLEMEIEDQRIRNEIQGINWEIAPKELREKLNRVDETNTARLKNIIKKHAWLTKDLVGVEGVDAAFLIVQHSPDIVFKEQMLPYLKKSYLNGEGVTGQQLALLTDRVLITQGHKQTYGTQFDVIDREIIFKPIQDEANVDKRRASMKMPPLAFYVKVLEEMYGIKDHEEIKLN